MWAETERGGLVNLDHVELIEISEPQEGHVELRAYSAERDTGHWILCSGEERAEKYMDKIAEKLNAYIITEDQEEATQ